MPELGFDDINFWLQEVKSCKERQAEELAKRNNYPRTIQYYEGEQSAEHHAHQETPTSTDRIKKLAVINQYFPNINEQIANIMFQAPEITVEATKPTTPSVIPGMPDVDIQENEPIMKSALTYGFNKLDALLENRIGLFDKLLAGYSALEVNHFVDRPPTKPKEKSRPSLVKRVRDAMRPEEELEEQLPPKEESKVKERTFFRRWNPLDILLDYRAERISDLRYIIKILRFSHAEFKAKYPAFGDLVTATETIPFAKHKEDTHKKAIVVYEIQQKKKDTYTTFMITPSIKVQEIDYFDRPYPMNGFNIKIGVLHEYGVLYPISFGQINKTLQDDINNYATHIMEVAERNIPKRGYHVKKVKHAGLMALKNKRVNEPVPCDGGSESIWEIPATSASLENKEMFAFFQNHSEKTWSVSEARTTGKSIKPEFAKELEIQEAGFQARQTDIQEGLRRDIVAQLDTLKDIIVTFWDDEHWFKITGGNKPTWYVPDVRTNPDGSQTLINPLTDILTKDYEVDVDISTALKPNKEQRKHEQIDYIAWLTTTALPILQMHNKIVSLEAIERSARDFGYNPKTLLVDMTPEQQAMLLAGAQGEGAKK